MMGEFVRIQRGGYVGMTGVVVALDGRRALVRLAAWGCDRWLMADVLQMEAREAVTVRATDDARMPLRRVA